MTSKTQIAALACGICLSTGVAQAAYAGDWNVWKEQDAAAPKIIYSNAESQEGVVIACGANGKLTTMLTLLPAEMPAQIEKQIGYNRGEDAEFRLEGSDATNTRVRYMPGLDMIQIKSHNASAKVFNAAVLGQPLTVAGERLGEVTMTFPKPDETFKAFASSCSESRSSSG